MRLSFDHVWYVSLFEGIWDFCFIPAILFAHLIIYTRYILDKSFFCVPHNCYLCALHPYNVREPQHCAVCPFNTCMSDVTIPLHSTRSGPPFFVKCVVYNAGVIERWFLPTFGCTCTHIWYWYLDVWLCYTFLPPFRHSFLRYLSWSAYLIAIVTDEMIAILMTKCQPLLVCRLLSVLRMNQDISHLLFSNTSEYRKPPLQLLGNPSPQHIYWYLIFVLSTASFLCCQVRANAFQKMSITSTSRHCVYSVKIYELCFLWKYASRMTWCPRWLFENPSLKNVPMNTRRTSTSHILY